MFFSNYNSNVDVTGVSEIDMELTMSENLTAITCHTVNEHFASIAGNPFHISSHASDSGSSDSDSEEFSRLVNTQSILIK